MKKVISNVFGTSDLERERERERERASAIYPTAETSRAIEEKPLGLSRGETVVTSANPYDTRYEMEERPPVIEKREKAPVLQEHVRPYEKTEVQPVIHREREQVEVHEVVQPLRESLTRPTQVFERVGAPVYKPEIIEKPTPEMQAKYRELTERYKPTVEYEAPRRQVVERPPVVHEIIKKVVIEEVQPVIYREVTEPHVIVETRPIYEKVREAPKVIYETRPAEYLHHKGAIPEPLIHEKAPSQAYYYPGEKSFGERPPGYLEHAFESGEQRYLYPEPQQHYVERPLERQPIYQERGREYPSDRPIYTESAPQPVRTYEGQPLYERSGVYERPAGGRPYERREFIKERPISLEKKDLPTVPERRPAVISQ